MAKSVQNDMSSLGFHLSVPSSALCWAVGWVGLAAQQISPAFERRRSVGDAAFPAGLELLLPVRGEAALTRLWSLRLMCHMGLGYFFLHLIVLWGMISLGGGSDVQMRGEPARAAMAGWGPYCTFGACSYCYHLFTFFQLLSA